MMNAVLLIAAFAVHAARATRAEQATQATHDRFAVERRRELVERWRESVELDLPGEVVGPGLPLVTAAGALAKDGEAIALVARALALAGDDVGASKLLEGAAPDEASRGYVELARARLAIEHDDLARARQILLAGAVDARERGARPPAERSAAVRWPELPECWLLAGRALARSSDGARAAPLLERYLALAPLDAEAPSAWHMLAQITLARGDARAAEELRSRAQGSAAWQAFHRTRRLQVRENPDEPLPRLGLCELYLAAGDFRRALEFCVDLTRRSPQFCRGWLALAQAERGLAELTRAREHCEKAVACDATLVKAQLELARILSQQGEREAALQRYARYRELGGEDPLEAR